MNTIGTVCVIAVLVWPSIGSAEQLHIGGNARAFHEDQFRERDIAVEPAAVNDVEILVELVGIPNLAKINELRLQIRRSIGLQNAFALYANGYRSIVYDPNWAAVATADFYLALGHEAGHLFCGHVIGNSVAPTIDQELEADQFGGASIRRFEVYHNRSFFPAVMAVAMNKYPEQASPLYPSRGARLAALRMGYEEGSPCGGLAPVSQPGFSRGVR